MNETIFKEGDYIRNKRAEAWSSLATYRILNADGDKYALENTYDRPLKIPKWFIDKHYVLANDRIKSWHGKS